MNVEPTVRESLMDPQQATLQVVMVDDEEALCLGVRRIIQKYRVHVRRRTRRRRLRVPLLHDRRGLPRLPRRGRVGRSAAARPEAAGRRRHGRPRRLELPGPRGADDHDHRLCDLRDGGQGDQARRLRLPRQAVHARGAPLRAAQGDQPADPQQAGAQARRGEARDPLQLHLGARARAQGAAQRRRGLPQHPAHDRGRPEPADGRAQHRARRRHEEADHGPARPHAHRVRPARARHQSGSTCASWPRRRWSCSPSTPSAAASP